MDAGSLDVAVFEIMDSSRRKCLARMRLFAISLIFGGFVFSQCPHQAVARGDIVNAHAPVSKVVINPVNPVITIGAFVFYAIDRFQKSRFIRSRRFKLDFAQIFRADHDRMDC